MKINKKEFIRQNVGIDISKDDFKVCFSGMTSKMETVIFGSKSFDNTEKCFTAFLEWVHRKNRTGEDSSVSFTVEATGVYYESLAYFLFEKGYSVHVVLPNQSKKYGQSLGVRSKTDRIDAQVLSQMGLERRLKLWQPVSVHFLKLKQLTRERDAIIRQRTTVSNQLHAYRVLRTQYKYEHQGKSNGESVRRAEENIDFLNVQIAEIEKELKALVKADKALEERLAYVLSIPGVGFITAITIVAETNGFASTGSIKQLAGFAGLDVKIAESGKWKGKSRISKQGNRYIRKVLMFPAFSKIRHHDKTKKHYERLAEKKGVKMVAAVAIQRKLLALIYTLWRKQEMFSHEY